MRVAAADRIAVHSHVRARDFDGELVILDLSGGQYFSLRDAGARMWQLLAAGHSPAQIAAILSSEYEADQATLLTDCLQLVEVLIENGLVEHVPQ